MSKFTPQTEEKSWGSVQHIFASPYAGVSTLVVKRGYRCSTHYHEHRGNLFSVLEGCIVVELMGEVGEAVTGDVESFAILRPGDAFSVGALLWHRFRVLQSGRVVEVYWADKGPVRQDDIERASVGGGDNWSELVALYGNPEAEEPKGVIRGQKL